MGSKLEKGLEGKKNERFRAQISVIRHQVNESQTHFSHLLLLVCTSPKPLYRPKCPKYPEMTGTDWYDLVSEVVRITAVFVPVMVPV